MKFFIVFALCVAAVSARFVIPDAAAVEAAEIEDMLAVINNPSTDPATAAALQQLLNDILGIVDSPIHVGPAIVEENEDSPINVGPAIIDHPVPSSSPLVQIIIKVKSGALVGPNPVEVIDASPVVTPEESLILPGPGFIGN